MMFTVPEMQMLCVMHEGTISATLGLLYYARETQSQEKRAIIENVIEKLSSMKSGDTVSLTFDPE